MSLALPPLPLPLLMLATLRASSGAVLIPVLSWSGHGRGELATRAVGSCAQCGVFCLLLPECRAVSCSGEADTGTCRLLGEDPAEEPLCTADWTEFGGACFSLQSSKLEWNASKAACGQLRSGSELASIHSEEENNFVKTLLSSQGAFIGLEHTGSALDYDFRWLDGTPLDFTHWKSRQPNERLPGHLGVLAERQDAFWMDYTVQEGMTPYGQLCKYTP